jgi:hypothetical protein
MVVDLLFHVSPARGLATADGAAADEEDAETPREDIAPGTTIRLLPRFGALPEEVDSPILELNMTEQRMTMRMSSLRILELTPEGYEAFGFMPPYAAVDDGTSYATSGVLHRRYAAALAAAAARGGPVVQAIRLEFTKQPQVSL